MARTLYQKFRELWKDKPDKTTPVTAEALNHIEQGIYDNSDRMALKEIYGDTAINLGRKSGSTVGSYSTAEGNDTTASGIHSHAEGDGTNATGLQSHAEGVHAEASGRGAHAEGNNTKASGAASHAEGYYAEASADYAHAEGYYTVASGTGSHAEGNHTETNGYYQHVQGKYNEPNSNHAFQIGNGSSDNERSNACYVDWNGNAWFAGNVSNNKYNLNDLGAALEKIAGAGDSGDEDISSQCYVNTNGQAAEITIPIDGIVMSGNLIAGGFFLGVMVPNAMPPLLLNADISITKYVNNSTKIEETAELINAFASTTPQFGSAFDGSIEVVSLAQDSATTCKGTVKMTFDLGVEVTASTFTIYKSSKYYYPIAHLVSGLTERIEALEQRIAALESAE